MGPVFLSDLAQGLTVFDARDLLATAAALQLIPENADRAIRLEAFAHVVASMRDGPGRPTISSSRLRQMLNGKPLGQGLLAQMEDPFENPFTEAFTFIGGGYVVFPWIVSEATFIVRHLARVLIHSSPPFPDANFRTHAGALLSAVLLISDAIARRAGLDRGVAPVSLPGGLAVVPAAPDLNRLKRCAVFDQQELAELLQRQGLPLPIIESLTLSLGDVSVASYEADRGALVRRPIVRSGTDFIVALPGLLLTAAWNEIIRLAMERNIVTELAQRYSDAVWATVVRSLDYLGNHAVPVSLPDLPAVDCLREGLFAIDHDKLAYVLLLTDRFHDYSADEPFGSWTPGDLSEQVARRWDAVEDHIFGQQRAPNEILLITLLQGTGRGQAFSVRRPPARPPSLRLSMTAGDLETIALLEAGDPLALWKYARASQRLSNRIMVIVMGELNKFHLYRACGHSFYLSDEVHPGLINIAPDGAGALRREVQTQRDWHVAPWHQPGYFLEVTTLHDTRDIPIYTPRDRARDQVALLVEGLALPVWVIGPQTGDHQQARLHDRYLQFAECITYWFWQFTTSLREPAGILARKIDRIVVQLHLIPDEEWFSVEQRSPNVSDQVLTLSGGAMPGTVDLALQPEVTRWFESDDNRGEREFMRRLLSHLQTLLPVEECDRLSPAAITQILDLHAPLGSKKIILSLNSTLTPDLDARELPPYRKVQDADRDELLDDLGETLQGQGARVGRVAKDKRTAFLEQCVTYYYGELERLVNSLSPAGLLEWLVATHESVTRESARYNLTITTRLACFGSVPEMVERLTKDLPERRTAALACRFLVEYVVARPPRGLRPISLSVYDRLLALASNIINFAFDSDLIYLGLADMQVSLLPSGRVGVDRQPFMQSRERFLSASATGEIASAARSFAQHWLQKEPASGDKPEVAARLDTAAKAEFGFSLTDLVTLLADAVAIGQEIDPPVARLPLDELTARLADRLGWPIGRVAQALDLLSLGPRTNFLKPPAPYRPEDVYPWRFNRPYSYLRRPFLRRTSGGVTEMLWGTRHTYVAIGYLMDLCVGGRLQARSPEMRKMISEFSQAQGRAFNDKVAELLERRSGLIVRRRVKKVGSRRLTGPAGDLGDIDVLAADPAKRLVRVMECKDLAVARTPREMANELANLFGEGSDNRSSIVQRHQRRIDWVGEYLADVIRWLGLDVSKRWRVQGLIVVDQELFTPHLWPSPIAVVSYDRIVAEQR